VPHLVWDWNGTLLDDLTLVVAATNASLAAFGGPVVSADEHRRDFRRPVADYYAGVLGRVIEATEFARLDAAFQRAYGEGLLECTLSLGAREALAGWSGTQSLLSMWFHDQLVPTVTRYQLDGYFARVDGLRERIGGGFKAPHLVAHLSALGLKGSECVLIGDSVDDAEAAASVGARCVLYTGGFTDRDRLRAVGVPMADTLREAVLLARESAP
jgi:phosphoglycolate phosphatase-like HAD superfamily hydrolase